MHNRYRLSAAHNFKRTDDSEKVAPRKIYFISIEGNKTEKAYFKGLSEFRKLLSIEANVKIEVLGRRGSDTDSAPRAVIELLEECVHLRAAGSEGLLHDVPEALIEKYGWRYIGEYLDEMDRGGKPRQDPEFVGELEKMGYDLLYRHYLEKADKDFDVFCIVVDRDARGRGRKQMIECLEYCEEKGYRVCISNPCFEFWLLMHLCDVHNEYADKLELFRQNQVLSNKHTFTSLEVSKRVGHGKRTINFEKNYLPNVQRAIAQSKSFATDPKALIDQIGTNIGLLVEDMQKS